MSKFTPGPWIVRSVDPFEKEIDAPHGDPDSHSSEWSGLAVVYGSEDDGVDGARKAEANSSLISAAPDMHKVCEGLERWWRLPNAERSIENIEQVIRDALEALAKADGK